MRATSLVTQHLVIQCMVMRSKLDLLTCPLARSDSGMLKANLGPEPKMAAYKLSAQAVLTHEVSQNVMSDQAMEQRPQQKLQEASRSLLNMTIKHLQRKQWYRPQGVTDLISVSAGCLSCLSPPGGPLAGCLGWLPLGQSQRAR